MGGFCNLSSVWAKTLYVAPSGNDQNSGEAISSAFATIGRARDMIRKMKSDKSFPSDGVTVEILGGKYVLTESLGFSADDSGTAKAPVIYRAYQNQEVKLLGGKVLSLGDFKPVQDPGMLERLDESARAKVVCASVEKLGLSHAGPFPAVFDDSGGIFELFWNGKRVPLSRWPNTGWTTMKKALVNGDKQTPGVFEYRDDRPLRWLKNSQVWLKGQWRVAWEEPAIRITTIDPAQKSITFAVGLSAGIGNKYTRPNGNGQEQWCAVNLPEEIDQPGEWAIDFATKTLYFWPPDQTGELMISQLDKPMIALDGAAYLKFIGLTLECSLGEGVVMKNAESDLVAGCTIRNVVKNGVVLSGSHSGVQSCDIYNVGAGCVMVAGGDKRQLISSGNFVLNNHLHHYGVLKSMYSAGVDVGFGGASNAANAHEAVGIRVANNVIHDAPRDAVLVAGQNNIFEFNEIYNCGFGSGDVGAFYSWLDWTIRGIQIRYNFMHDTVGGVNPDDGASGSRVFGNIFMGPRSGVWIASGPDHAVENNIFVKEEGPVYGMDDRGIGRKYATNKKLLDGVAAVHPQEAPWSTQFPEMVTLLESHPETPLRNRFCGNVVVIAKGNPTILKMSKANQANPALLSSSNNFVTHEDPGFVDPAHGNFGLKTDSAVFKNIPGFEPIPFEKIGLKKDEYRTVLPSDAEMNRTKWNGLFQTENNRNFGT